MRAKGLLTFAAIALLQTFALTALAQTPLPGTPDVGYNNIGGATLTIAMGSVFIRGSAAPQPLISQSNPNPFFALPGDIVYLNDPNAGHDPSNWLAVLRFFNPADPTGALGLDASLAEVLVPENTPQGLANVSLFPNVAYAPVDLGARSATEYFVTLSEFGLAGAIQPGQLAIINFIAGRQVVVPEPSTFALLGFGSLGIVALFLRRRSS